MSLVRSHERVPTADATPHNIVEWFAECRILEAVVRHGPKTRTDCRGGLSPRWQEENADAKRPGFAPESKARVVLEVLVGGQRLATLTKTGEMHRTWSLFGND